MPSNAKGSSLAQAANQRSALLSTPADAKWLSPALCLLRSQIEYFAAQPQDLTAKNRTGGNKAAVVVGQVGIRCVWCKDYPRAKRSKGSELYPSNIGLIHQAVRNYQRHHYKSCTRLPANVRNAIDQAKTQPGRKKQSKSNSKDYWSQSAREAGLVDDDEGIFFADADADTEVEVEVEAEAEVEQEEEEAALLQAAAAVDAEAEPLPFDSIALFGHGLGLIDDNEDGDQHRDHQEIVVAAEKPHKVEVEQEAVQECMYPSSAPAPAPVHAAPHHSTTSDAESDDDAMLHEALAILSDDAEDEVGSEDGSNSFEPSPMKEELQSTYSTASTIATATDYGHSTGIVSEGSAQAPTSWYGSRGPAYTRDQHPLAYSNGLISSNASQPRRHSTMSSSYRTTAEQQHYQPRRFSLAGAVSPNRSYHCNHHHHDQAAEDQQRQHMQFFHNHPALTSSASATTSASDKVAPMIPFTSPAQGPLAMPLPLPGSAMVPPATALMGHGAKRRASLVSSTSSTSVCNSPAVSSTSTSRSSSYGFVAGASTAIEEETMVFPAATAIESSNKRARYE